MGEGGSVEKQCEYVLKKYVKGCIKASIGGGSGTSGGDGSGSRRGSDDGRRCSGDSRRGSDTHLRINPTIQHGPCVECAGP